MNRFIRIALSVIVLASVIVFPASTSAAAVNLVANPSVETASGTQPANWSTNSWGTNTAAFSYASTGHTGSRSLSVTVSGYSSGDAKWMADQAAVTAGQTYTYSDYSQSAVTTELDAAYVNSAGVTSFAYLQTIPASTTWQQNTASITIPAGIVSMSVYHIIYSNGTLQTDDFSLIAPDTTTTPPVTTPPVTTPPVTTPPATTGNLIANNSFETANGTDPASWNRGGWGTNTSTLTYATTGHTGSRSASIAVTSYTSGDAKWYATPVAVTAGSTYTYQDYYTSNVVSRVSLAMTNASNVDSYTELATAPVSSTWGLYTANITIPTGIKSVTVYHLLDKVGTLSIDDVSLALETTTPPVTPPATLIANPSFETANGAAPASWTKESWGTNTHTFQYLQTGAHTGSASAKFTISKYTSGDAKWAPTPVTGLAAGQYTFSAWYKTNTQPHVVVDYVDASGVDQYMTMALPLPASNASTVWQQYTGKFDLPAGAKSTTIDFLIQNVGWVQTDDFSLTPSTPVGFNAPIISLTFDDGWQSIYTNGLPLLNKYGFVSTQYIISGKLNTTSYMTTDQVKAFQATGSEIGGHTATHPDLTTLTSGQLTTELKGSQTTLRGLFGATVATDFASPYGSYNATDLAAIKLYYASHRSTDVGYNTKDNFNAYNIVTQSVDTDTTTAQVAAWVAEAKAEKAWLVLVFHEVDTTNVDAYAVTPANLDTELANIKSSGVSVQTVSQALATVQAQL